MLDVKKIKDDFPWFSSETGKNLLYADSAATTHKPKCVIETLSTLYGEFYAAVNRISHETGEIFSAMYFNAHKKMAAFIGGKSPEEIIFTRNCTDAINHVANAIFRTPEMRPKQDDRIICTVLEHHSNMVPWQELARLTGCEIVYAELNIDGTIDIDHFKSLINKQTRLAVFTHVSNVLGTVNPVQELCNICSEAGVLTLIDGTQAAPRLPVDVTKIGCDFYTFSGHKMLGPTGVGILWGKKSVLEKLRPSFYGGGMIDNVTTKGATWNALPWRLEYGTPSSCEVIALTGCTVPSTGRLIYGALDYLSEVGMEAILSHEKQLASFTIDNLSKIEGVKVTSIAANTGIVTFNIHKNGRTEDSHIIGNLLSNMNIINRTGGHCAYPLHEYLGLAETGTIRLSYYLYNDKNEAETICEAIKELVKTLL